MARSWATPSESDRSFAFNALWLGLADTLFVIATVFLPALADLQNIALMIMSGSLIGLVFIGLHDEFAQAVVGRAATFACAVAGLLAFLNAEPMNSYIGIPPVLSFALISLGFHVPLAVMRLRGG